MAKTRRFAPLRRFLRGCNAQRHRRRALPVAWCSPGQGSPGPTVRRTRLAGKRVATAAMWGVMHKSSNLVAQPGGIGLAPAVAVLAVTSSPAAAQGALE